MSIFEIKPGPDPDIFSFQIESHGTPCMMAVLILERDDLIGLRNALDDALDGTPPPEQQDDADSWCGVPAPTQSAPARAFGTVNPKGIVVCDLPKEHVPAANHESGALMWRADAPEQPPVQTEVQLAELLEIQDLRIEHKAGVTEERSEEIVARLAELGTVVYPPGTPEYAAFEAELAVELDRLRHGR